MININEQLPDFSADAFQDGLIKKVNLQDYRGKWLVMVFYPADFTFICPTELGELSDRYAKFQELGAEVISVSTDTAFVHKAWHDASKTIGTIKYPMVADPTGNLSKLLGVYIEEEGVALRGSFIFDPAGKLKTIEIHDNSIGRSADELLRKLQAAKFVEEHGGEVCPASWKPGAATLKPGVDLIGKI
jgi:peroxiredoxin (alkyl hydroperoxide reductase subunit C)